MTRGLVSLAALLSLGACATEVGGINIFAPKPDSAEQALELYYDTIPNSALPSAGAGAAMPSAEAVLTTILIGSCLDEEKGPSAAMTSIANEQADLFLMVGDNVYGDRDGRGYVNNQADLDELRESFADLAAREDFQKVRAAHPMMVAWDDHDYGANDAGKEFPFRGLAERVHEAFWGLEDEDVGQWAGTYYARSFGPEGQRVQVIMLDTRFFRSALTPTDEWGAKGKERYLPAPSGSMQDMLGAAQWTWLENQLQQPADIRLIASSVQVMPTVHGWEAWSALPDERQRLFNLIKKTEASGVVFLSGDRHTSFIYEEADILPYAAHELTASSLNVAFATESAEMDARQVGAGFAPENYGAVEIDWEARTIGLKIKDNAGQIVRENDLTFAEIGVN
ncbi:MAG: alkaline phosphatase family protein [Henriciella sp.]|nr:alkaline phosphatase family protein [Henriciella sp.]MBO6695559.1 alkaline phosphatase family protein [Henriciella sp.]